MYIDLFYNINIVPSLAGLQVSINSPLKLDMAIWTVLQIQLQIRLHWSVQSYSGKIMISYKPRGCNPVTRSVYGMSVCYEQRCAIQLSSNLTSACKFKLSCTIQ